MIQNNTIKVDLTGNFLANGQIKCNWKAKNMRLSGQNEMRTTGQNQANTHSWKTVMAQLLGLPTKTAYAPFVADMLHRNLDVLNFSEAISATREPRSQLLLQEEERYHSRCTVLFSRGAVNRSASWLTACGRNSYGLSAFRQQQHKWIGVFLTNVAWLRIINHIVSHPGC